MTITSRIRNAHPDHHAIARGMALGALFVFLSKLAGAAKEMAVAWRYGVSEIVDAYLFIFNLVTWPVVVWFGVLVVVLIPLAATIRERNPLELPRFRSELLGLTLLAAAALWLVAEAALPIFLRSSSGLSGPGLSNALDIAGPLSWITFLGMPISLLSAWVMASGRHTNTLFEGIPALVILIVLLSTSTVTAAPLVWGTVAGYALHLASLSISLAKDRNIEAPRFGLKSSQWKAFCQGFGVMLAGQALLSLSSVVDQLFAARLGAGSIATMSYANRIVALILGLGATAISRATLPVFSEAEAKGSTHVSRMAMYWSGILFLMGAAGIIVAWWLAPVGVAVLFQRGAFTPKDTAAVAEVLRYGLFQLPIYLPSLVLVSVISSRRQYGVLFMSGLIGIAAKLTGNALLAPVMGINGLVLSNAFVYAINCTFLFLVIRFRTSA